MCGAMLLMAAMATGVDPGWQPLPDGGMEYIIQIEPHSLESLEQGEEIICDIPQNLKGIKSYRIRVGNGPVPQKMPPAEEIPDEPQQPAAEAGPVGIGMPPDEPTNPFSVSAWPSKPATGGPSAELPGDAPRPFEPPSTAGPVPERQAVFNEPGPQPNSPEPPANSPANSPDTEKSEDARPWLPFTLALAAFFGALGGMLYTGWIAWDYRRRYQVLLEKTLDNRGLSVTRLDEPDSMIG